MTSGTWNSCITTLKNAEWSVSVMNIASEPSAISSIYSLHADRALKSAGLAKMVMLLEIARRIETGTISSGETRSRASIPKLGTLGLWQHFNADRLPINDIALLVAATGDNLATNVLLKETGVESIVRLARDLGLDSIDLTDHERNVRDAGDVLSLFHGSAEDWVLLLNALYHGRLMSAGCAMSLNWMSHGLDSSMVSGGFDLAYLDDDAPLSAGKSIHISGSLRGACAEAGILLTDRRTIAYSAVANWKRSNDGSELRTRAEVMEDMRRIGRKIFSSASIAQRSREPIPA